VAVGYRLLLIEDDIETAEEIIGELSARGYSVSHVPDGTQGLAEARSQPFALIIVDRMLPGLDGLSVIESLRRENSRVPVLVVSALSDVDERVKGLRAGGDDYLTKPFAFAELVARIEALLRRPSLTPQSLLRAGPLEMELIGRTVRRGDRQIDLLPREFKLLEYMMRRPNQILTRAMLLEDVWNYRFLTETNVVDVHIGKLRRKVDAAGEEPLIHSVRGAGFTFRPPA
jgi:two-component system OmpR family response regulator